jgi:hypothetical protein
MSQSGSSHPVAPIIQTPRRRYPGEHANAKRDCIARRRANQSQLAALTAGLIPLD